MDEKLTAFFGSNAKMVGDYFAKAPAGPERDARMSRATKAAETNDRKARKDVVNLAAYWLARWERFGAVC
jgi:hypothetical protein